MAKCYFEILGTWHIWRIWVRTLFIQILSWFTQ